MIGWLKNIEFLNPEFLWGLLLIPLLVYWEWYKKNKHTATFKYSDTGQFVYADVWKHYLPIALRSIALAFIIVALARPQSSLSWNDVKTEGIDIIITMDISGSMLAEDFKPNRLEASKELAMEFIGNRPNDRIGLVLFSGESFTQCPLTTDHNVLLNLFQDIRNGMIEDGTAIGVGLANAINRLKESDAKSKVVILLTDGNNTAGSVPPLTAGEIAKEFGVRVYTIGVGSNGTARTPFIDQYGRKVYQNVPVKIDEDMLEAIAEMTNGKYFRATSKKKLKEIYEEIDQLEKSIIHHTEFKEKNEQFYPFALIALGLLLLEFLTQKIWFKSIV
ncbi:MAG: VWA domain-containing protein [Vicingaceae bacterium]